MNISDWMKDSSEEEQKKLAAKAKTTPGYLRQLAGGHRKPSRKLAERLEEHSAAITPDRVISKVALLFDQNKK